MLSDPSSDICIVAETGANPKPRRSRPRVRPEGHANVDAVTADGFGGPLDANGYESRWTVLLSFATQPTGPTRRISGLGTARRTVPTARTSQLSSYWTARKRTGE